MINWLPPKIMMRFTDVATPPAVMDGLTTETMDGVPSRLKIRFSMLILITLMILIYDIDQNRYCAH